MKSQIRSVLRQVGLDVRRRRNMPFGVTWEEDLASLLGRRAQGATMIDVGANIGQTAQSLAAAFPAADILSFEPVPALFAQLQRNTSGLARVECVNSALGDRVGTATMTTDRDGQNTLVSGVRSTGDTATVQVSTLDAFCAARGIGHVDLLKIDTEGFETSVLRGAGGLLAAAAVDFVLAECDFFRRPDEPHGDFFEIHEQLAAHGFRVVAFYSGGVDDDGWVWGDVLMVRQGVVAPMAVSCSPHAG